MNTASQRNSGVIGIIMAAGRGSRMNGYAGNKTLLPLVPGASIFEGQYPIIEHILAQLPKGPKAVVVHHCKDEVVSATSKWKVAYCEQTVLNGTGGALLAATDFIRDHNEDAVVITMGDVPFVKKRTYCSLVNALSQHDMVILGFQPVNKKKYGVLEIQSERVRKIVEWKDWHEYHPADLAALDICNAGIYAVRKDVLERYFPVMAHRPQVVHKMTNGRMVAIEEFFLTDLVEFMVADSRRVGYLLCENEMEPMGIDDPDSLEWAQKVYKDQVGTS